MAVRTKLACLLLILLAAFVYALTVEDVIQKSKEDPEIAWDLYLALLSNSETPENLEGLGRFLHAKRKLKSFQFAVEEDIEGLVDFLSSSNVRTEMKVYILEIFGEDRLRQHLINKLPGDPRSIVLLKVLPIVDEELLEVVYKSFVENSGVRRILLDELKNPDRNLEKLVGQVLEKLYSDYSSTKEDERKQYLQLYEDIRKASGNRIVYQAFEQILAKSRKIDLFAMISPLLNSVKNSRTLLFIGLPLLALVMALSLPSVRYNLYMLLGMKKRAALIYKRIVEKDPLNEEKRLKLAQLYESAGMYEEALNEYNFLKRIKIE